MKDPEIKEKYKIWLMTDPKQRKPKTKAAFGRKHDVTTATLNNWENEKPKEPELTGDYDSVKYLLEQLKQADSALVKSCLAGNATAQKVLRQILGQLSDKGEDIDNDGFTASEIARIRSKARRELEAEGYPVRGNGEVRTEQSLLPQEVWQGKGQD